MNRLDRLLQTVGDAGKWQMMINIDANGGDFDMSYSFWDGVNGSGGQFPGHSRHNTIDEAIAAADQARKDFPYKLRDIHCIIDDFSTDPGGDCDGKTP